MKSLAMDAQWSRQRIPSKISDTTIVVARSMSHLQIPSRGTFSS